LGRLIEDPDATRRSILKSRAVIEAIVDMAGAEASRYPRGRTPMFLMDR
jgi:hypothetical protein